MTYLDAHCHPLFAGRELQGAILHGCQTIESLVSTIRDYRSNHQQLTWLDLSAIDHLPGLDRYALDAAVNDIPLVVHTTDHHSICVNSKALEIASFDQQSPAVTGGIFEQSQGKPNGWIHEYVAMQLIYQHQPQPSLEEDLAALMAAQKILIDYEVSEVVDAWIDPGMPEVYLAALERDLLELNYQLCFRITPENAIENIEFAMFQKKRVEKQASLKLKANTVKFFVDGVFSSGTAWLKSDDSTLGVWKPETLLEMASRVHQEGFKLHFHACGDAAVHEAVRVVEKLEAKNAVIAHADLIDPLDIPKIAKLGITINSTPVWAETAPSNHYNYRALIDAGVKLTWGSDWPVSQPDPKALIAAALKYRGVAI